MPWGSRSVRPLSRPVHRPLSEADVSTILRRMQERFPWPETAERFVIADRWGSRTASLYRCRGAPTGRPDVMLKVGRGWTTDSARAAHEEMDGLAGPMRLDGPISVRVPTALGWDEHPPLVCTRYVEGTDVFFLLADLTHTGWGGSDRQPIEVLEACGRALGVYHARFAPDPGDPAPTQEALRSLARAARALGLRRSTVARLGEGLAVSRGFGDFGPHQFRLAEGDELYLLDPPVADTFEPVHKDVARFTFGLAKILGRDARAVGKQRRAGSELREAFIRGYRATGLIDLAHPRERWLVRLYEGAAAAGMAHKRLTNHQYGSAGRYATQWVGTLLALRSRSAGPNGTP